MLEAVGSFHLQKDGRLHVSAGERRGRLICSTEGKQGVMLGSCVRSGAPVCRTGKGMGRD